MAFFKGYLAAEGDPLDTIGRPRIRFDIQVQNVE
jgi:hypothetical protein